MSYQDWKPVVFKSKKKAPPKEKVVNKGPRNPNQPHSSYKEDADGVPVKKTLPKNFGQKMQQARAAKGWNQKELARRMNCKVIEIQSYEQGKVENPNRGFARKIERVVGGDLFGS